MTNTTPPSRLRFRAWRNGKMYTSCRYENICGTSYVGGRLDGDTDVSYEVDGHRTVVMQSTGLTDKNGEEIFEGDVVHWSEWIETCPEGKDERRKKNSVVNWSPKSGAWILDDNHVWNAAIYSNIEVIGNIYEHRSLLGNGA